MVERVTEKLVAEAPQNRAAAVVDAEIEARESRLTALAPAPRRRGRHLSHKTPDVVDDDPNDEEGWLSAVAIAAGADNVEVAKVGDVAEQVTACLGVRGQDGSPWLRGLAQAKSRAFLGHTRSLPAKGRPGMAEGGGRGPGRILTGIVL